MVGRDARHGLMLWLPVALVVGVLVAAGVVLYVAPPDDGQPDRPDPSLAAPSPGLELPEPSPPDPVAEPASGTANPAKVRRALAALIDDPDLGPHVLATVAAPDGTLLYANGTGTAIPASTLKLLTATAALDVLGPEHTFTTRVVADGPRRVVLVGGGDPLLSADDLARLARVTARGLGDGARVRVGYDTSLFSGPDVSPRWPDTYVPDGVVSPIQSLWVDEGRDPSGYGRVGDPALVAAGEFATALGKAGVRVVGDLERRTASADAAPLAEVESDPLDRIVEHVLEVSDNEGAEVLARQVGLAVAGTGSFAAGARAVRDTLAGLGVPMAGARTYDGSGLSRDDRLAPETITAVLEIASSSDHPALRATVTGLPVAGFTGSLSYRFDEPDHPGRGLVRAKTGTLSGVSGLAGTVTDRTGTPMVFAFLADRIDLPDTLGARAALDDLTGALASCRCGGAGTVAP